MYDIIKANLRFGMYRYANTELEREVAGLIDEQYEDNLMGRLTASRHTIGYAEALQLRDLAEFAAARPGTKPGERFSEWAADEISAAMRWTRNMAFARLHLAVTVTSRLPGTLAALSRGDLDMRGVQALAEITAPLDDKTAREVEEAVLPKAGKQNTTELRRAARRAVLRLDPAGAQQRHEVRKQERRVELTPLDDAMAELRAVLPAADATAIYQRLDAFAYAVPADDERTVDQRRADVFTDLLLGVGSGITTKVTIQVTVPASTLMGVDEQPGDLAGYGPIPCDVARDIAAGGTWRRLLSDPVSGALLDYGRTTYRPPAALADFVRARDHHCVFPGCSRRADACDIDHHKAYPDGPTSERNTGCLCRHHHRLRHEAGWTLEYVDGVHIWTTPDGRQYRREPQPIAEPAPPPHVKPADEPPPF